LERYLKSLPKRIIKRIQIGSKSAPGSSIFAPANSCRGDKRLKINDKILGYENFAGLNFESAGSENRPIFLPG